MRHVGILEGNIGVIIAILRGLKMARLKIMYRILPKDTEDSTIDKIIDEINSRAVNLGYIFDGYKIEPIAFGLNSIKVLLTFEDENSNTLNIFEQFLDDLDLISSWEVIAMSRC